METRSIFVTYTLFDLMGMEMSLTVEYKQFDLMGTEMSPCSQ